MARPLDEGFQRPPLYVQRGLGFEVLRLLRVLLRLHRDHRFLVALRMRPVLRLHEQQPAGDHQGLQHVRSDLPDADPNRERLTSNSASGPFAA